VNPADHVDIYLDFAATLGRRTVELRRALALPDANSVGIAISENTDVQLVDNSDHATETFGAENILYLLSPARINSEMELPRPAGFTTAAMMLDALRTNRYGIIPFMKRQSSEP